MGDRYSRQELFSPIGKQGQDLIRSKHVLVVGAGALGSANCEMLTRAGVGKLTIIDRDYVEESNLQRQQLYTEADVQERMPKAEAARRHLQSINSDVEIEAVVADGTALTLQPLVQKADVVIDSTDNFETRMIINDLTQKYSIPWIYGACVGSSGMSFTIIPGETPCLHCLLSTLPIQGMTCDTNGIIAPAVTMVVAHQHTETLKMLTENWSALRPGFVSFDVWNNQYHVIKASKMKKSSCLSCGEEPTYPFLQIEKATKTAVLCGRNTVQIRPSSERKLNLVKLAEDLRNGGYEVKANAFLISLETNGQRMVIFQDGRALVHDTKDEAQAKSLYQRILG
ncbi:MoeB/ThiF family adenylyltransferase [Bacillus massiliigorillae]|uniref:MoeB/ThiF family adenylyltransferase n=1 Tax=Bacillus massiliigorillae TaxID=1243664 RepID=UPI00039A00E8|nr:MoeB/ThiF family adenylyltransferase [Bacillus massiliigorillae]